MSRPGASCLHVDDLPIAESDIQGLLEVRPDDVSAADQLTFAKNIFLPLTTACRYSCGYCTFFDAPGNASILSPSELRSQLETATQANCTEALFTFGDRPDDRYTKIFSQLDEWGYNSFHDYLIDACKMALEYGLLPHVNPGDQTAAEMQALKPTIASMGAMLETTADVTAHSGHRSKSPAQRLHTIDAAGRLQIPFTTGLLLGIGESWRERAVSLLAIAELHRRHGHIQEVLIQPVVPNNRWQQPSPSVDIVRRTTAMARVALPQEVSIQVPPNLTDIESVLDCGVDDLGGISPITDDYVNPDHEWPELENLRSLAQSAQVPLLERFPVRDRFLPTELQTSRLLDSDSTASWLSGQILTQIKDLRPLDSYIPETV